MLFIIKLGITKYNLVLLHDVVNFLTYLFYIAFSLTKHKKIKFKYFEIKGKLNEKIKHNSV